MSEKMRVTTHNGRVGRDGAYSVKHNDRKFNTQDSTHIDSSLTIQNYEWKFDIEIIGETSSFEEHEQKFYEYYFSSVLNQRNEKAKAARHYERIQTMEQYRRNKRACPEETILQIGCASNTVDAILLKSVCEEYIEWHKKTYPNVRLLDAALHIDEPNAAPHLHLRRVWTASDQQGNLLVSQSKALEQLGIKRPYPEKKQDRYNNPKVVFTQQCRAKFIEICEKYGVSVEHIPLEPSKSGLTHDEYIRKQEQRKIETARAELTKLQEENKPFIELEVTTQTINANVKVKSGIFGKSPTVTMAKLDFDILLQQAQSYIVNRDDIDNLRAKLQELQKQSYELSREKIYIQDMREKAEYLQKQANRAYNKQLNINIELEDAKNLIKYLQETRDELKVQYKQVCEDIKQSKQSHQDEIILIRQVVKREIEDKDKEITVLKRKNQHYVALCKRYVVVLTAIQQFLNTHSELDDEQKLFFQALEKCSLDVFDKFDSLFSKNIRQLISELSSKSNIPEIVRNAMNSMQHINDITPSSPKKSIGVSQ